MIKKICNKNVLVKKFEFPQKKSIIIMAESNHQKPITFWEVVLPSESNELNLEIGDIISSAQPIEFAQIYKDDIFIINEQQVLVVETKE